MKQSKHRTAKLVRDYLIIFVIGAVLLYPIIWMLFASFKSNDEIFGSIRLLPQNFSFKYFIDGWKGSGKATYTNFFINTSSRPGQTSAEQMYAAQPRPM